ncbi:hypothetical protein GUJ93_ZPchr2170g33354 [Zizania palustris]|uniref:Uncharacterized protein n=1 Tax=Zizania palustris TaxID=103762 RepID=A0A8J5QZ50_ZIZPA|nr:hypothetical protein GUJ93_ZPchr2170g33342 [Zizania palustris]KAG8042980.1 hypothetical protein GUJ93_ZPchr2170g33354 [Zizania palustris]
MSSQSDLNSGNPIENAMHAIMKRLDSLDEKLQPLQPLQEKNFTIVINIFIIHNKIIIFILIIIFLDLNLILTITTSPWTT